MPVLPMTDRPGPMAIQHRGRRTPPAELAILDMDKVESEKAGTVQILVVDDMLGLFTDFRPKFVKRYAELGAEADRAIAAYAADVRARRFPAPEHVFGGEPGR